MPPPSHRLLYLVRPTVAIMQWKNEIEAFTDGIKVAVWHGAAREGKISELKKFNVVSGDFYP